MSYENQEYTRDLGECVYKNVQVTTGVLPGIPRESVA